MKRYILLPLCIHLFISSADPGSSNQLSALDEDLREMLDNHIEKVLGIGRYYRLEQSDVVKMHKLRDMTRTRQLCTTVLQHSDVMLAQKILTLASKSSLEERDKACEDLRKAINQQLENFKKQNESHLKHRLKKESTSDWLRRHKDIKIDTEEQAAYMACIHAFIILKQEQRLIASNSQLHAYSFALRADRIDYTVSEVTQQFDRNITQEAATHSFDSPIIRFFRNAIGHTPNDHLEDETLLHFARKFYEQACRDQEVYKAYLIAKGSDDDALWSKFCTEWAKQTQSLMQATIPKLRRGKTHKEFLEINTALELTPELTQKCRALFIVANACSGQLIFSIMNKLPNFYKPWTRSIVIEEAASS